MLLQRISRPPWRGARKKARLKDILGFPGEGVLLLHCFVVHTMQPKSSLAYDVGQEGEIGFVDSMSVWRSPEDVVMREMEWQHWVWSSESGHTRMRSGEVPGGKNFVHQESVCAWILESKS